MCVYDTIEFVMLYWKEEQEKKLGVNANYLK